MERVSFSHLNKFRPAAEKSEGMPRCSRDEQLDIFLARLNASRIKDGFPKLTHARVAKMLTGIPTSELYPLYQVCDRAKSFGGLLNWKLKQLRTPTST